MSAALIAEARKALESERSADQLETLHGQLKARITECVDRLKAITAKDTSSFGGNPGPERKKVVAAGDVEALRKLDEEVRDLGPVLEVLRNLKGSLRRESDAQRAREYAARMPHSFAELDELLAAEAQAQAAARKASQATAAQLKELGAQRHHVTRQNGELPAAAPELLARYMQVMGYNYLRGPERVGWFSPTSGPQELKNVAAVLGVPVPHPDQGSAAA